LRNYLGGFGFRGDQALEPIGPFSGGEKSRLALALLIYIRPNLLLLDEPTNHLDLTTRDALSLALQEYEGALVVVSHDRYLLRTVADQLWLVADGAASPFDGDLDDYRRWLSERRNAANREKNSKKVPLAPPQQRTDSDRQRQLKPLQTALQKAEAAMNKWLLAQQELVEKLANPDLYQPDGVGRLQQLLKEKASIEKSVADAENRWLEASEAVESASAN
jgi:ATP-binding cassette subfamily F protein 3